MPNMPQNFWNFSIQLYALEGVADACLQLQNECELDVNLILFCYWHGVYCGEIQQELLEEVVSYSIEWRHQVVRPLRNLRTWMKQKRNANQHFNDLREQIKAAELSAEKHQQNHLFSLVDTFAAKTSAKHDRKLIKANMDKLLRAVNIQRTRNMDGSLEIISSALELHLLEKR
jgi:uncharacterized protein (TIGR02444 family)